MKFYSFDEIRNTANCRDIVSALYGITINGTGRCAAVWRKGTNPASVSVDAQKWYDHGSKTGGGAIELVAIHFGGDKQAAQEWLGDYYHLTPKMATGSASERGESRYDKLLADGYWEAARYEYRDMGCKVRHVTVRMEHNSKPKSFVQGHPDANDNMHWSLRGVETILYRLPEIAESPWVLICEGEKSADRLAELGIPATTAPMGAGKWLASYSELLRGKNVAIAPDNDGPGRDHAQTVARALHGGIAASVRIIGPLSGCEKGGIDDWLDEAGGRSADDVLAAIAATPDWTPPTETAYTGPTEAAMRDAKAANTIPFRNFIPVKVEKEKRGRTVEDIQKEPRTHAAMTDDLFRRFLGFPRKVGDSRLFDYDRASGTVIDIDTAEGLVAWIGRRGKLNPEFARGDAMVTPRQFRESVLAECRRYESISMTPDWPARPDVYYAHGPLPAACPDRSRFATFCDFFLPASEIDALLIRALVCCPLWYVPGLPRPSWIVDSHDGQGSGKSNLIELVSELYGHAPIRTSKQELSTNLQQLTRRCLSRTGRDARIMLVDNVTGDFQSPELADLITSKYITGMAPYGHGEETRPNNLVYAITANSATVSTDLADRSIYIHVRKPERSELAGWKEEIQRYIAAHRLEIFADIIATLSTHTPFEGIAPATRFPEFEVTVLQPCCGTPETLNDILEYLAAARADSNIEEDQARLIAEAFEANIASALNSEINQPVFIRSELANSWGRVAIMDSYQYKGNPMQLIRNLAKLRLLPKVDRHIVRWPTSSAKGTRNRGVAWGFTDSTEEAIVLSKGRDGEVLRSWA